MKTGNIISHVDSAEYRYKVDANLSESKKETLATKTKKLKKEKIMNFMKKNGAIVFGKLDEKNTIINQNDDNQLNDSNEEATINEKDAKNIDVEKHNNFLKLRDSLEREKNNNTIKKIKDLGNKQRYINILKPFCVRKQDFDRKINKVKEDEMNINNLLDQPFDFNKGRQKYQVNTFLKDNEQDDNNHTDNKQKKDESILTRFLNAIKNLFFFKQKENISNENHERYHVYGQSNDNRRRTGKQNKKFRLGVENQLQNLNRSYFESYNSGEADMKERFRVLQNMRELDEKESDHKESDYQNVENEKSSKRASGEFLLNIDKLERENFENEQASGEFLSDLNESEHKNVENATCSIKKSSENKSFFQIK